MNAWHRLNKHAHAYIYGNYDTLKEQVLKSIMTVTKQTLTNIDHLHM